jgi:hypothetical protein
MGDLLVGNINNSRPTIIESGYKLNELLIQCIFNGRSCNENFTTFFHPNYGNCYTFNIINQTDISERNNIWSIEDENIEDGYKLFLELFLYQNEYIPYLDDRAAFRIFIHRKNEIPILSENSLFLAPTTFTKLIFSQRMITFSQQCRKDLTDDMKQMFNSDSVRYSQALCFKLCEFRFIQKEYQCTDQIFMVFIQFFSQNRTTKLNTNRSCPINHKHHLNRHHLSKYLNNKKKKNKLFFFNLLDSKEFCPECLPECELIQYTIQSSYADYPNSRSTEKVLQRVANHLKNIGYTAMQLNTSACLNNRKGTLLDDIVAVEISASPYATEILAESPMYTWVDLISSIGGQTG